MIPLEIPQARYETVVDVNSQNIFIAEGGNYSIDIYNISVPKKSDAMRDFITQEKLNPSEGFYFGNQNQSPQDRDAAMCEIEGLKVFGVDEKQNTIIPQVEPIGAGVEATLQKLQELLASPPPFIGFDIDDTLLGLRSDKTKEDLLKDRYSLGETLLQLALEGTLLAFFSDNDSEITLKRIGYPLNQLFQQGNLDQPITLHFYTSKMVTKISMKLVKGSDPEIKFDATYGSNCRLDPYTTAFFLLILGEVKETSEGQMTFSGIVGQYYTQNLTLQDEQGLYKRNNDFYPEFKTQMSSYGNVIPPQVQCRDFNPDTQDSAMISIGGVPSGFRAVLIKTILEALQKSVTFTENYGTGKDYVRST